MLTIHEATFVTGDTAALLFMGSCSTPTNNNAAMINLPVSFTLAKILLKVTQETKPLQLRNRARQYNNDIELFQQNCKLCTDPVTARVRVLYNLRYCHTQSTDKECRTA